jgi:hypothetical protein
MARRFDAAATLVEQSEALPAAGTWVRSAVQLSPGHPGTPAGSAPPHHLGLGEHLTSATGRAPTPLGLRLSITGSGLRAWGCAGERAELSESECVSGQVATGTPVRQECRRACAAVFAAVSTTVQQWPQKAASTRASRRSVEDFARVLSSPRTVMGRDERGIHPSGRSTHRQGLRRTSHRCG